MKYSEEEIEHAERRLLFWSWCGIVSSFALVCWLMMGMIQ